MRTIRTKYLTKFVGGALMGVTISLSSGSAQDEALKTCREDWRTSQAAIRANGMNQKMFMADCQAAVARSGATSPGTPESQTEPTSATVPATNAGKTLRAKARVEEWRTKRRTKRGIDELQGLTEKANRARRCGVIGTSGSK